VDPTSTGRNHVDDLRGAVRLVIEATTGVGEIVEAMQQGIGGGPPVLGRPFAGVTRFFTAPVHRVIRGVARLVGTEVDSALARVAPLIGHSVPGARREAALAILNGVLGDHLAETGNPLAISMSLRRGSRAIEVDDAESARRALSDARRKVLVLVHGSCLGDRCWIRPGHDLTAALERDLGFTCLHLHYNTGRHISTNGTELAKLLERLVGAWPVRLDGLALVGHSMGGLVARSACHAGDDLGHTWRRKLTKLVCIASPHHGAALERGGNWIGVLLGVSHYSAPLARLGMIRSAGVTDLRFGNVLDEHWRGRDRFAARGDARTRLKLPEGVQCYAMAATRTSEPGAGPYASDGLVSVESALGRHRRAELTLAFPDTHRWIGLGMGHLDLLGRPEAYDVLRSWLSDRGQLAP
jgi:pimeloyl-ACP methyl ester carboxylesterase